MDNKKPRGAGRRNGAAPPKSGPSPRSRANGSGKPAGTLSEKELAYFRTELERKRAELVGDVEHMKKEALGANRQEAAGDLSKVPIHMADVGSDRWEQQVSLGLIASEQEILQEIEAALARLRTGRFGICEATQKPIQRVRLRAQPWTRYCVEHVRFLEQKRA